MAQSWLWSSQIEVKKILFLINFSMIFHLTFLLINSISPSFLTSNGWIFCATFHLVSEFLFFKLFLMLWMLVTMKKVKQMVCHGLDTIFSVFNELILLFSVCPIKGCRKRKKGYCKAFYITCKCNKCWINHQINLSPNFNLIHVISLC